MSFNPKARLDTRAGPRLAVRRSDGGGCRRRRVRHPDPRRQAGGGIGGILIIILFIVLAQCVGGGIPGLPDAASTPRGCRQRHRPLRHCETGADAEESTDCARVAVENSLTATGPTTLPEQGGADVPADRGDADLQRQHVHRVRPRDLGGGPVLLPRRQARLPRHHLLRGHAPAASSAPRLATSPSRTSSPTSTATTSRTCSARWARCRPSRAPTARRTPGAAGRLLRRHVGQERHHAPTTGRRGAHHRPHREDIQRAIDAATAVGDDRIQQRTHGRVNEEQWTHGSAAARMKWFQVGYTEGSLEACDTFAPATVE